VPGEGEREQDQRSRRDRRPGRNPERGVFASGQDFESQRQPKKVIAGSCW
jgi:hypothetical protein